MKKTALFFIIFLLTNSLSSYSEILKVATEEIDYYPFYFSTESGYSGASVEIITNIASKLGYEIVYYKFPWERALAYVKKGKTDLMIQCFKTKARNKNMVFLDEPTLFEASHLFTKKGRDILIKTDLKKMAKYRFGAVRGYSYGSLFDNADYLVVYRAANEKLLIKMLMGERFDIGIGFAYSVIKHAKKLNVADSVLIFNPPVEVSPAFMAFSKKLPEVHSIAMQFTRELIRFKKTEAYEKILQKYDLRYDLELIKQKKSLSE